MNTSNVGGLTASAVLVDLNVSVWTARKKDKGNTQKIVADNQAKASDAALVTKRLFVGNPKLDAIVASAGKARNYVAGMTLPWTGNLKLLPITAYLKFQQELQDIQDEFSAAVSNFITDYDLQISTMAFKLGSLFNRSEYPTVAEIQSKFAMNWSVMPLPESGDFRVDAENALREELASMYESDTQKRVADSVRIVWDKLRDCLEHMQERLADDTDGKRKIFRDSMLDNANELIGMMDGLNITNDPTMEAAKCDLARIINSTDASELRKSDDIRKTVHAEVSEVIDKYKINFG